MSTFNRPATRPAPPSPNGPGARALAQAQAQRTSKVEIIQPDQYADRRAEPRVACDDAGALLFLSTNEIVTCRILDQSASGARVAFDKISGLPPEIWMIDIDLHTVRRGAAAWSTVNRMGLKFDLIQQLTPGGARPAKVPEAVYAAWLRLTGQVAVQPAPVADPDDVLYFD